MCSRKRAVHGPLRKGLPRGCPVAALGADCTFPARRGAWSGWAPFTHFLGLMPCVRSTGASQCTLGTQPNFDESLTTPCDESAFILGLHQAEWVAYWAKYEKDFKTSTDLWHVKWRAKLIHYGNLAKEATRRTKVMTSRVVSPKMRDSWRLGEHVLENGCAGRVRWSRQSGLQGCSDVAMQPPWYPGLLLMASYAAKRLLLGPESTGGVVGGVVEADCGLFSHKPFTSCIRGSYGPRAMHARKHGLSSLAAATIPGKGHVFWLSCCAQGANKAWMHGQHATLAFRLTNHASCSQQAHGPAQAAAFVLRVCRPSCASVMGMARAVSGSAACSSGWTRDTITWR